LAASLTISPIDCQRPPFSRLNIHCRSPVYEETVTVFAAVALLLAQADRPPDYAAGVAMVENAIKATLKDPDSAKFTWAAGFTDGVYKRVQGFRSTQYDGWLICGTVNAKNGYGGYSGQYAAIGVIAGGAVVVTDMDEPGQWSAHAGWVADQCRKNGMPVL
jgi:hypothetical protein